MKFSEYIWFWETSWSYMKGSRLEFWIYIIPTTFRYRKIMIEDQKRAEDAV